MNMKNLLLAVTLLLSTNVFAIDAYSTESENVKKVIKLVIKSLKAPDSIETEKKIHKAIKHAFTSDWNSYWLGYNDLSSSKIKNPEVSFIEYLVNTEEHGTYFFSFLYDKKSNQILINNKQIRYGTKDTALELFTKNKDNTEKYEIRHEKDTFAMLQVKGKVDYEAFNIGSTSASVIYFSQTIIDM
ncbi:MAG: hypothetical protein ACI9LM_004942 [Alteromonadaceae bacterium]|jgi:hypothetical protein